MVPYKGSEEVRVEEKNGKVGGGGLAAAAPGIRYWECMKNHAAGLGAQAFDGCGEFMPGGEPGTLEALKCAACGCHRNFHRKEDCGSCGAEYLPYDHGHPRHHHLLLYNAPENPSPKFPSFFRHPLPPMLPLTAHPYRPLPFTAAPPGVVPPVEGSRASETPPPPPGMAPDLAAARERERERSRKRFRTKFTQEQKEEMQKFAEKVGWRIQRHDNDELQEFCSKVGVKRQVLKVWMHNNKGALSGGSGAGRAAGPSKGDPAAPAIRV
ncbi:hypothetical protein Taro_049768 [Colocasia esculenta]|uniref:ZF-HD dimerization-type domain-containing protein n=1 Tax=Colocasia esculenta TaxID=4460 RepID=A0A843XC48_COLES|nr:hypothetical protein [Colocasia esculenta]